MEISKLKQMVIQLIILLIISGIAGTAAKSFNTKLNPWFYATSCPNVKRIVDGVMAKAVRQEPRIAASILRLHFHDCFGGCDGSILLDDTPTMLGEKTSPPNNNSARGYDIIDRIKAEIEAHCPGTVSCADILALAAEAGVRMVGGPPWVVPLGRRDSLTASFLEPLATLPAPFHNLSTIISRFEAQGLSAFDAVVLSGAHTIGFASCGSFQFRLYNFDGNGNSDPSLSPVYKNYLQRVCPQNGSGLATLNPLDFTSVDFFDNNYFTNLLHHTGLLFSDQQLIYSPYSSGLVRKFSRSRATFFRSFVGSVIKMASIRPPSDAPNEIRLNCRIANP